MAIGVAVILLVALPLPFVESFNLAKVHSASVGVSNVDQLVQVHDVNEPQLTPTEFLLISSASERKVVYTQLANFKSTTGRTYALIDAGLEEPRSISFDPANSALYVADKGARRIYRYNILLRRAEDDDRRTVLSLSTDGMRTTVVEGHEVEWLVVGRDGSLLFSDLTSRSVNKIEQLVLQGISEGALTSKDLSLVYEDQLEKAERGSIAAMDVESSRPRILMMYMEGRCPQVSSVPAGVATDGVHLYWGNAASSLTSGSLAMGQTTPQLLPSRKEASTGGAKRFPAAMLANNTDVTYGVLRTGTMVLYSSRDARTGEGVIYGVDANSLSQQAFPLVTGLGDPRGMVWDGENTAFVGDQASGAVWSFPGNRKSPPVSRVVDFSGAFGVALARAGDLRESGNAAHRMVHLLLLMGLLAGLISL